MDNNKTIVFNGGLNSDDDPRTMPSGDYSKMVGFRSNKTRGNEGTIVSVLGNSEIPVILPDGDNKTIGFCEDVVGNSIFYLVYNSNSNHCIFRYLRSTNTIDRILYEEPVLNFSPDHLVLDNINLVDNVLFWVDSGYQEARALDYEKARRYTAGLSGGYNIVDREVLSAARIPPVYSPIVSYSQNTSLEFNSVYKKFFQFAYRYVYYDGSESVFSGISSVEYPTFLNTELNEQVYYDYNDDGFDGFNEIIIEVNTGPRIVEKIEIVFREGNEGSWYLCETIDKYNEDTLLITGATYDYVFRNDYKAEVVNVDDVLLVQNSFPEYPKVQEVFFDEKGSYLMYGDYKEGKDKVDTVLSFSFFRQERKTHYKSSTTVGDYGQGVFKTMPFGGRYKVALVYIDFHGNRTLPITKDSYFIDVPEMYESSAVVNQSPPNILNNFSGVNRYPTISECFAYTAQQRCSLIIDIDHLPPSGYTHYEILLTEELNYSYSEYRFYTSSHGLGDGYWINLFDVDIEEGDVIVVLTSGQFELIQSDDLTEQYNIYDTLINDINIYFTVQEVFDGYFKLDETFGGVGIRNIWQLRKKRNSDVSDVFYTVSKQFDIINPGIGQYFHKGNFQNQSNSNPAKIKIDGVDFYHKVLKYEPMVSTEILVANLYSNVEKSIYFTGNHLDYFDNATFIMIDVTVYPNPVADYRTRIISVDYNVEKDYTVIVVTDSDGFDAADNLSVYHLGYFDPVNYPEVRIHVPTKYVKESEGINDFGKLYIYNNRDFDIDFPYSFRFSQPYFKGRNVNNIRNFNATDYQSLLSEDGNIYKLIQINFLVKVLQSNRLTSVYIGRRSMTNPDGQEQLILTDTVIGTINRSSYQNGSLHPGSIASNDRHVYFFDLYNSAVFRDSPNGQHPISNYKMSNHFKEISDLMKKGDIDAVKMNSAFDREKNEYILSYSGFFDTRLFTYLSTDGNLDFFESIEDIDLSLFRVGETVVLDSQNVSYTVYEISENVMTLTDRSSFVLLGGGYSISIKAEKKETIIFEEESNRWKRTNYYYPDIYAVHGDDVYSFLSGKLYKHKVEGVYNTFYGERKPYIIKTYDNSGSRVSNIFTDVSLSVDYKNAVLSESDLVYFPHIYTDTGQESYLNPNRFEKILGKYSASFLKDINTNSNISDIQNLYNGDDLTGEVLTLELTSTFEGQIIIFYISVNSINQNLIR